jgi:predicted TIM-barrel fold metal-dependent hydrolase
MPIATKPAQVRSINNWAVEINRGFNQLICFGTIHPKQDDWQHEIDLLVSDGIRGVKFHPDYQEFFVDDAELTPLYNALADAGLIVLFHAGVDIGLPPPVHCTPEPLSRVVDAVPDLIVIAAHMGGYALWDDVHKYLAGRDIYLDTSYSMNDLGTEQMTELIRAHGADKVLFGTDSPWTDQKAEVSGIRALQLKDDEINGILGGNAERLLLA